MTRSTVSRPWWSLLLTTVLLLTTTGCVTTGSFPSANVTNVELSEGNYEIVATDVAGEASAGYILGFSAGFGVGSQMSTLAVARVQGEGTLYREAIQNLWANFRAEYGEVEGRDLALVNVRFDGDALNLILYTRPIVSIRADVVEFTE
jgi:hypothetical protein